LLLTRFIFLSSLTGSLIAGTDSRAAAQALDQAAFQYHAQWTQPGIIDSRGPSRGAFASFDEYYSAINGRTMSMQELLAGVGITDRLCLWAGRQDYLLHGHHAGSRFSMGDDFYGGKWVIKRAQSDRDTSFAAEFQAYIPGTADATVTNSSETFDATKDTSVAVDFGPGHGWQTQLSFTAVRGFDSGYANVYSLGAGKDISVGSAELRIQGQLIDQNSTDTNGIHTGDQVRPVFYAAVGYNATEWLRFEADGTLFPSGMPLAGTDFTGIDGFLIYNPGGAANLSSEVIGVVSARVVLHWKF
jgi:hypothetical protein